MQTKAIMVSERGWVRIVRSPFSPSGKVRINSRIRPVNSSTSARIAPSWITTVYIFQYGLARSTWSNASTSLRCAVELTGRNSVSPSTIPSKTDRM